MAQAMRLIRRAEVGEISEGMMRMPGSFMASDGVPGQVVVQQLAGDALEIGSSPHRR